MDGYLLSCKVEGLSAFTVDAYRKKLSGFLWYAEHFGSPDNPARISTQHIRYFLAYLRDNEIRFGGKTSASRRHVNSTTLQRYYRVLSSWWSWMLLEELVQENPLSRIRTPRAEKKVVKGLSSDQVSRLLEVFDNGFLGKRNRALILVMVDSGLRLGEVLNLTTQDVDLSSQMLTVRGKTGERVARFGTSTARALLRYQMALGKVNNHTDRLWLTAQGRPLTPSGVESLFLRLSAETGIRVHPHLLRHTFATMWLLNGGDSLMLQRLLGHSTLSMTNRYAQAVGCLDAIESHKKYSPVDNLRFK